MHKDLLYYYYTINNITSLPSPSSTLYHPNPTLTDNLRINQRTTTNKHMHMIIVRDTEAEIELVSANSPCTSTAWLVGDILLYRVSMSIYMLIYKKPREEAL